MGQSGCSKIRHYQPKINNLSVIFLNSKNYSRYQLPIPIQISMLARKEIHFDYPRVDLGGFALEAEDFF